MYSGKVIIGVGGTIGSGKTTVSRIFESMGGYYISADEIGWGVLPTIAPLLEQRYGPEIMDNGDVNRKRLSEHVFADPEEVNYLNSISHPLLIQRLKQEIEHAAGKFVIIDAALLFDWPQIMAIVDCPILVTARESVKEKRALDCGMDPVRYRTIRANQSDDDNSMTKARFTIRNNGTVDELYDQCRSILKEIQHGHRMQ